MRILSDHSPNNPKLQKLGSMRNNKLFILTPGENIELYRFELFGWQ